MSLDTFLLGKHCLRRKCRIARYRWGKLALQRYAKLIWANRLKEPHLVLKNLQACLQKLIPPEETSKALLQFESKGIVRFDALIHQLQLMA